MPKFYYLSPDESQGDTPLREDIWFERYQDILVSLANTVEGRALLLIDDRHIPVVEVRKNCIRYDIGGGMCIADFRVGAKWANIIRYRWREVKKAYDRMILKSILGYPLIYNHDGRLLHPVGGGLTLTVYPDRHVEVTSIDGCVGRASIQEDWDSKREGDGSSFDDNGSTMRAGNLHSYQSAWRTNNRSIILFDTSSLGAGSTISAAVLSMTCSDAYDSFSDSTCIVLVSGNNSNTALQAEDYQNAFTIKADPDTDMPLQSDTLLAYGSVNEDGSTYNDFTLNSTGRGNISLTSITKFGAMGNHDRTDAEPGHISDASGAALYRTSDITGTSADPKLVITYIAGFTPRLIMF